MRRQACDTHYIVADGPPSQAYDPRVLSSVYGLDVRVTSGEGGVVEVRPSVLEPSPAGANGTDGP